MKMRDLPVTCLRSGRQDFSARCITSRGRFTVHKIYSAARRTTEERPAKAQPFATSSLPSFFWTSRNSTAIATSKLSNFDHFSEISRPDHIVVSASRLDHLSPSRTIPVTDRWYPSPYHFSSPSWPASQAACYRCKYKDVIGSEHPYTRSTRHHTSSPTTLIVLGHR